MTTSKLRDEYRFAASPDLILRRAGDCYELVSASTGTPRGESAMDESAVKSLIASNLIEPAGPTARQLLAALNLPGGRRQTQAAITRARVEVAEAVCAYYPEAAELICAAPGRPPVYDPRTKDLHGQ